MLDSRLRRWIDPPLEVVGNGLARRGLSADQISIVGFLFGLAAIAAIAGGLVWVGLVLFLVNRLADGLDGAVARATKLTDRGGFLDIVFDFIVYAGMVWAFALADPAANAIAAAFLLFAFMGTGSSFLAFAVMAGRRGLTTEARGKKSLYYLGGLTEGSETIGFFVLACLFPTNFPLLAWVFAGMCWLTTAGRIATGWRLLR
ncbi:MAG: CDP-alcohol phosphatidyltransferase family protein [Geminicoccaceae bacterium]|nr:CDP-alcohol phosphatidyltransferase family protein [Geminicoccaceae bacterium]MDW8370170.1 CDP-alcohol phosphatidyltransferase family protein [Geminicoccaceae bacterium]